MPQTTAAEDAAKDAISNSPGVASVLPFLYIAWADGLLTPTQIERINAGIKEVAYNAEYPLGGPSLALLREANVKVRKLEV